MFKDKVLVFDVDATLYPASSGIEAASEELCIDFFVRRLGFDRVGAIAELQRLRQTEKYETALVEKLYGIPQGQYLEYVCATDVSVLSPNPELAKLLAMLSQRKFILTDATLSHAQDVLKRLGVDAKQFELIFDATAGKFSFKYTNQMFEYFFAAAQISGSDMVLFEDSLSNLSRAKQFGAVTIWISEKNPQEKPPFVDLEFSNINKALEYISA